MDISVVSSFLMIMNNTVLNIHVYIFVWTYVFSYFPHKKNLDLLIMC